ncbi:MAG: hypothetical protein KatS3mg130_0077 [Candidatus Sumerlaea sp.]|nr:MAG: hypothetical protein KatS3mg130_0077 [Candidatus Sumerlaea sp.]
MGMVRSVFNAADRSSVSPLSKVSNKALGQLLVERGFITAEQCEQALQYARSNGMRLGEALIALEFITPSLLSSALAEQFGTLAMVIEPSMLDIDLVRRFPLEFLHKHKLLPLLEIESQLIVAVGDPNDTEGLRELSAFVPGKELVVQLADAFQIEKALEFAAARLLSVEALSSPPERVDSETAETHELLESCLERVFEEPNADVVLRTSGDHAFVVREKLAGDLQRLPLRVISVDVAGGLVEALRARTVWWGHPLDAVGHLELPVKFQGRGFRVQAAYLLDGNGAVVRLRALSQSPPSPCAEHISVAERLRCPLTVIRYEDASPLAQFFSSLCSTHAGDCVVLFTDVVRCLFPRAIQFSALASDPVALARRLTPSVVAFDVLCAHEVFDRLRAEFPRPPRVILAAPLGAEDRPLPTWMEQFIRGGQAAVVRLTASTCSLEVLPPAVAAQPEIPEEQRWT